MTHAHSFRFPTPSPGATTVTGICAECGQTDTRSKYPFDLSYEDRHQAITALNAIAPEAGLRRTDWVD